MPPLIRETTNDIIRVMSFVAFFFKFQQGDKEMAFVKYTWVGNRISEKNMASLYKLKTTTRKPITEMVAEAVELYLSIKATQTKGEHGAQNQT